MKTKNRFIPLIIIISLVILVSVILFLIYTFSGNYIEYGALDNSSESTALNDANNSNVIIVNGIVLGGR